MKQILHCRFTIINISCIIQLRAYAKENQGHQLAKESVKGAIYEQEHQKYRFVETIG